jgi:ABC-type branched-subunit amino acid transport system ATPase component
MPGQSPPATNPFRFGDLALDEAFTDRTVELADLVADVRNGQNVVVFAPRRYGKSSLIWRAAQELVSSGEVLVAQVDVMRTSTKERFAEKLAATIYEDIASPLERARDRALAAFRGLRVSPTITVTADGTVGFSFRGGFSPADIDATIEHLLELPGRLAAERGRRAALVFDEFQEIVKIDRHLIALMRSVFQEQAEVAHVYLGSRRHMMEQIFDDENEPFWRSAKRMELGVIDPEVFAAFVTERFAATGRAVAPDTVDRLLEVTLAHPYGTQELAYELWEVTPPPRVAGLDELADALARVLRSEDAHFAWIWERAPKAQRVLLEALAPDPVRRRVSPRPQPPRDVERPDRAARAHRRGARRAVRRRLPHRRAVPRRLDRHP